MNALQKSLLVAGVLGLGSTISAPAFAQDVQAYASGSASIVLMNGASQSIGAEIAAPSGVSFAGPAVVATVNPVAGAGTGVNLSDFSGALLTFNVNPGTASGTPSPNASVEAAVATIINTAGNSTSDAVSVTRAWGSGLQ